MRVWIRFAANPSRTPSERDRRSLAPVLGCPSQNDAGGSAGTEQLRRTSSPPQGAQQAVEGIEWLPVQLDIGAMLPSHCRHARSDKRPTSTFANGSRVAVRSAWSARGDLPRANAPGLERGRVAGSMLRKVRAIRTGTQQPERPHKPQECRRGRKGRNLVSVDDAYAPAE